MNISLDCIPCIVNSFAKLLSSKIPQDKREDAMRRLLAFLSTVDYQQSPPALGREMHRLMRGIIRNPDPYLDIKKASNEMMLREMARLQQLVRDSDDPFQTAMRLAVAGNVIDYGPQDRFDVWATINRVLQEKFAVDDSELLRDELKSCKQLLYVADNCGEIVLDKIFLETIEHAKTYFAVRGGPAINDATMDDALQLGLDKLATVVTTGDDAPGAVWETTSDEFKNIFLSSDVVISKGQGNLEGLIDVEHNIYFLFVAKCDLIAARVGAQKGDFIVRRQRSK
jgi:uncharacterized protein with ATP-grasp and redox domains